MRTSAGALLLLGWIFLGASSVQLSQPTLPRGGLQQRAIRRLLPASVPPSGWGGRGGGGARSEGGGFRCGGGVGGPARGGGGAPDPYIYGLKWPSHRADNLGMVGGTFV